MRRTATTTTPRRAPMLVFGLLLGLYGAGMPGGEASADAAQRIYARGLFKDRAMLEIDGTQRLLRAGQTSPEGVTLVSANARQAVIERGGERVTLELGGSIGGGYSAPRSRSYRILPSASGMFLTIGSVNGYPVRFLVDTGATLVSMSSVEAKRLGIDFRVVGRPAHSATASGIASVWLVRLERVKVGEIELSDVDAAVHEGRFPQIALLGMSFLNRLELTRSAGALLLEHRY